MIVKYYSKPNCGNSHQRRVKNRKEIFKEVKCNPGKKEYCFSDGIFTLSNKDSKREIVMSYIYSIKE